MSILGYTANIAWGSREDTPEELALRIIKMMPKICELDPVFSNWFTLPQPDTFEPLELKVASIAEQIAAQMIKDDDGEPSPREGYRLMAYNFNEPKWTPRGFSISVRGGSHGNWAWNSAYFSSADMVDADLSLATFSTFKSALLALSEAFDASYGGAFSTKLSDFWTRGREATRIDLEWMTYLGPRFAHLVTPPPTVIVERRANGGLFMAATDESFSTDNPTHMAASRDILAAVAPFNALKRPYPGLEGP